MRPSDPKKLSAKHFNDARRKASQNGFDSRAVKMQKFLIFAAFAIGCVVGDISDGDCLRNYFSNQIERASLEDSQSCDRVIGKYVNKLTGDFMARLKVYDDRACVLNNFHDYKIADLYLKGLEYHLNNHTSEEEFNRAVEESTSLVMMYIKHHPLLRRFGVGDGASSIFAELTTCRMLTSTDSSTIITACQDRETLTERCAKKNILLSMESSIPLSTTSTHQH